MSDRPTNEPAADPSPMPKRERKPPPYWLPPEEWEGAKAIIHQLNETNPQARHQLVVIVQRMGLDFAQSVLQETLLIEAQGGIMLPDGSRRRTMGGVFFYVARERMPADIRVQIFRPYWKKHGSSPAAEQSVSFRWDEREILLSPLLEEPGTATTVKAVLMGLPTNLQPHSGYVTFQLTYTAKTATLPKGVPYPELPPTHYRVYVSNKQWKKIETASTDAEDSLIIEGTCGYDPQIGGMAFYATNITSKQLEAQKRPEQGKG